MNATQSVSLYTATRVFKGGSDLTIEVDVPNFSTRDDAEAYAMVFRIRIVDGRLYREDGKNTGIFDDSWREVPDSQITVSQVTIAGVEVRPSTTAVAQWLSVSGLNCDFTPHAWHVEQGTI